MPERRNPDEVGWPPAWDDATDDEKKQLAKDIVAARIELRKKLAENANARQVKEVEADLSLFAEFHKALMEVGKGAIERARSSAETVQKASAAIAALYTGILGAAFSVADHPLPVRGVLPVLFLGLAICLSTAFVAYLNRPRDQEVSNLELASSPREAAYARSVFFLRWTNAAALRRAWLLQASVIAVAVAVPLLPAPFVTIDPESPAEAKAEIVADWPGTPTTVDNIELQKIAYQAQVNEFVAALGEDPVVEDQAGWVWWAGAGLGLFLVLFIPTLSSLSTYVRKPSSGA